MIVSHLVGYLEYLENGTADDNHNPIFELCDPNNLNLEYKNMAIALLVAKLLVLMVVGHLVGHLKYVKNCISDDNGNPMFELCDPTNPY